MKNNIQIIPLGGVKEDGENLYAVKINDNIYILDCGLKYPNNEMLGIDLIIPKFNYLKKNKEKIVGVFLTHGHNDAIGALPYFLREFDVPVFGSSLTIAMAKLAVHDHKETRSFNNFNVIDAASEIVFNDVTVSFFKTTHSIPDSMGIVLNTSEGQIVYTGDFKFDQTAVGDYETNLSILSNIGQKDVLALLSDSSNAENYDESVSEAQIEQYISDNFLYYEGRIIVACDAYNILRIQQVFNAAYRANRKVFLTNRGLKRIINVSLKLNKLHLPDKNLLVSSYKEMKNLSSSETVVLQTGQMGEPIKDIQRMANQQSGKLNINNNDLVVIATTPSHAMETKVAETKDMIYKANGTVKMISDDLNSSENASRSDLQLMLNLIKPKYFIPVQGEYRMLSAHARLAQDVGIHPDHIFIPRKGEVLQYNGKHMIHETSVESGDTIIDGSGIGDVGNIVLRDRKALSEDGIFVAVVSINRKKRKVISMPKITSRGFIYVKANKSLMNNSSKLVYKTIQYELDNHEFDWGHLKQKIRDQLSSYLFKQTRRHPIIMPVIMEVKSRHKKSKKKS